MQEILGSLTIILVLEVVANSEAKAPFAEELKVPAQIQSAAYRHGVIIMGCRGTVECLSDDHLLLALPLVLTEPQADILVEGLRCAITEVTESLRHAY